MSVLDRLGSPHMSVAPDSFVFFPNNSFKSAWELHSFRWSLRVEFETYATTGKLFTPKLFTSKAYTWPKTGRSRGTSGKPL